MNSKLLIAVWIMALQGLAVADGKIGNLAAVQGVVLLDGVPGKNGMPLTDKSNIKTKAGTCTLLFGTDVIVHLDKNSNFSVEGYKAQAGKTEMGMKLRFGRLRALAANRKDTDKDIKIKTRTAVMGIRGTHIYIDSPRNPKMPENFLTIEGVAEVQLNNQPAPKGPEQTLAQNNSEKTDKLASSNTPEGDKKRDSDKKGPDKGELADRGKGEKGESKGEQNQKPEMKAEQKGEPKGQDTKMASGTEPKGPPQGGQRGPAGEGGPPTPGGPSQSGPASTGGPIVLAANQMLQGSGEMKNIEPGAAMNLANSVAPPPPPIQNTGDFAGAVKGAPPPPPPGSQPGGTLPGDILDRMLPTMPPPINFDPVADGSQFVPLSIQFQ